MLPKQTNECLSVVALCAARVEYIGDVYGGKTWFPPVGYKESPATDKWQGNDGGDAGSRDLFNSFSPRWPLKELSLQSLY